MSSKALHRSLEAKLAALDGPEWDSSDEEEDAAMALPPAEQPKPKKKKPTVSKQASTTTNSSVIYLGHLPVAFEEDELRGFLSQFGNIRRLRLARSKKTFRSKGFCFCEFESPKVASIVAETMGGYLLLEKRLVCHVVPPEKIHPTMFYTFKKVDWQKRHAKEVNQVRTKSRMSKITARLQSREKKKREKLKELGIDYDFPGYSGAESKETLAEETKENSEENATKKDKSTDAETKSVDKMEKLSHGDGSSEKKKKKKRKNSDASKENEVEPIHQMLTTPDKKNTKPRTAETEVKKKKKKKAHKKRRQSAP